MFTLRSHDSDFCQSKCGPNRQADEQRKEAQARRWDERGRQLGDSMRRRYLWHRPHLLDRTDAPGADSLTPTRVRTSITLPSTVGQEPPARIIPDGSCGGGLASLALAENAMIA